MAGEFQEKKLYHLLKLRSDQTDSVSVDLHQSRLDADGVPFSFDHTCSRLRSPEKKSRHSKIVRYRRQSATSGLRGNRARPDIQSDCAVSFVAMIIYERHI